MAGGAQAKMSTWFSKPNQSLISRLLVVLTRQLEILATTLELLGKLKPSYLFYLGLGNIPIEWNTGKKLKTHLGPGFQIGIS